MHHLYSCVKRKNQLDATYFIIYSILIDCSTCFGLINNTLTQFLYTCYRYHPWYNQPVSRRLLKMVVLTAETCCAINEYWINNKISGIKLVFFSLRNYKDDARSNKLKKKKILDCYHEHALAALYHVTGERKKKHLLFKNYYLYSGNVYKKFDVHMRREIDICQRMRSRVQKLGQYF